MTHTKCWTTLRNLYFVGSQHSYHNCTDQWVIDCPIVPSPQYQISILRIPDTSCLLLCQLHTKITASVPIMQCRHAKLQTAFSTLKYTPLLSSWCIARSVCQSLRPLSNLTYISASMLAPTCSAQRYDHSGHYYVALENVQQHRNKLLLLVLSKVE